MTKKTDEELAAYYERHLGYVRKRLEANKYGEKGKRTREKLGDAEYARRQRVWKHNSFLGHAVMMRQQLNAIISADSTTTETQHYAKSILGLVTKLQNSLTVRKD